MYIFAFEIKQIEAYFLYLVSKTHESLIIC
jgi:hypothetical protein